MKAKHRKILIHLMNACNRLGGSLDYTATHESKLKDRQRAHMQVYKVLYAILADHPENESVHQDFEAAEKAIEELQALCLKDYPDRNGRLTQQQPNKSK